jgi:hypothetical protein
MSEETVYKAEEAAKLNVHSSLPAFTLIGVGAALLIAYLFDIRLMDFLWPGFIIGPGLLLMWPAYNSTAEHQSKLAFLAVPGAMIATTGLLLFAMNLTNHFEAWAYSWTLVIAAAAGGVMYLTRYDNNKPLQERGYKLIRVLSMIFIGLAFFFEIIVFENFSPVMSLGLIGFGLYLLMRNKRAVKSA